MTNSDPMSLPAPAYAGGTKAITMTPIVGTPRREYAEMFVPGAEALEDGSYWGPKEEFYPGAGVGWDDHRDPEEWG